MRSLFLRIGACKDNFMLGSKVSNSFSQQFGENQSEIWKDKKINIKDQLFNGNKLQP